MQKCCSNAVFGGLLFPSSFSTLLRHNFFPPPFHLLQQQLRAKGTTFAKKRLRDYKFPELRAEDCEQQNMRGWGPGGSCVNAAGNAVLLRHRPTNCSVKVHESRNLHENIKIARERLKLAVDRQLNGANSYEAQFERLEREWEERARRNKQRRRQQMEACKAQGQRVKQRLEEKQSKKEQMEEGNGDDEEESKKMKMKNDDGKKKKEKKS